MVFIYTSKFCAVTIHINIGQNVARGAKYWPKGQRPDTKLTFMPAGGTGHVVLYVLVVRGCVAKRFHYWALGLGGRVLVGLMDILLTGGPTLGFPEKFL